MVFEVFLMIAGIFLQLQKTGAEHPVIDDLINISAANPGFPRRRESQGGGNPIIWPNFPRNCIKMKKNGAMVGARL